MEFNKQVLTLVAKVVFVLWAISSIADQYMKTTLVQDAFEERREWVDIDTK